MVSDILTAIIKRCPYILVDLFVLLISVRGVGVLLAEISKRVFIFGMSRECPFVNLSSGGLGVNYDVMIMLQLKEDCE